MVHHSLPIRGIRCVNQLFLVKWDLDFNKTDTIVNLECLSKTFHASTERRKTRGAEDALRNAAKCQEAAGLESISQHATSIKESPTQLLSASNGIYNMLMII